MRRLLPLLALSLLLPGRPLVAQSPAALDRIPPSARPDVVRIVDGARRQGLPAEPLIAKALEGTGYGAPAPRIVAAVDALARRLAEARRALGGEASRAELVAGADALAAGIEPAVLGELREARPAPRLSVALPLVVLTDLVVRGVPADAAAPEVVRLARERRDDPRLLSIGPSVERAVAAGASPSEALRAHLHRIVPTLPSFGPPPAAATRVP